ncbi:MAG: class I SAM-dependent methyltransferase [Saprospiraceae bacterium]|nr:class I SAM-dependent methyltransferase [Saprospiraceae bacterium]
MKDHFSEGSDLYKKFRPRYPGEIFSRINAVIKDKHRALDCGTGNGQIAVELNPFFEEVYAIDISLQQISEADKINGIFYSLQPAEKTNFSDDFFNLIVAGQAAHWFNFNDFFRECHRLLVPGGILALIGYDLVRVNVEIDRVIDKFYHTILGPYWPPERKYVDAQYLDIPFPYPDLNFPPSEINCTWSFSEFVGYLNTWSSVKKFIREIGSNPLDKISKELQISWGKNEVHIIRFPVFSRIGQKPGY